MKSKKIIGIISIFIVVGLVFAGSAAASTLGPPDWLNSAGSPSSEDLTSVSDADHSSLVTAAKAQSKNSEWYTSIAKALSNGTKFSGSKAGTTVATLGLFEPFASNGNPYETTVATLGQFDPFASNGNPYETTVATLGQFDPFASNGNPYETTVATLGLFEPFASNSKLYETTVATTDLAGNRLEVVNDTEIDKTIRPYASDSDCTPYETTVATVDLTGNRLEVVNDRPVYLETAPYDLTNPAD